MATYNPKTENDYKDNYNDRDYTKLDDDELDRQIAEAAAGQNEYDSWKEQLAKDCLQTGISFPTGHALQRAWNSEQKRRANNKKLEEKRAKIRARIAQLQAMLGNAQQELDNTTAEESAEPDFAAIEADLLRLQQQREKPAEQQSAHPQSSHHHSPPQYSEYDKNTDI